jgi:hypothetical protein
MAVNSQEITKNTKRLSVNWLRFGADGVSEVKDKSLMSPITQSFGLLLE